MTRRVAVLLGVIWIAAALAPAVASANLGPAPTACNAYAPVANCYYPSVSGTDTFTISSHFVHVGQVVTGTYSWEIGGQGNGEFPSVGSVAVDDYGQGLKLIGCHGRLTANNSAAAWHTPKAFNITKGHTTCRWRARFSTGWSTDLGLSVYASGGTYKAGDFYAVTGKTALEGTIRFKNDRNQPPTNLGVPGSRVHITGPRGSQYNASTNSSGYWYVLLNGGGQYHVQPIIPRRWQVAKPFVTPKRHTVHVLTGGIGNANFVVDDPVRVTLTLSQSSVPANGGTVTGGALSEEVVTGTVKVTDGGAPDPDFQVAIRPFQNRAMPLAQFPVLARVCGSAVGSWPTLTNAADANREMDAYTDASGQVKLSIIVGTTPGTLSIEVRPTDQGTTAVQTTNLGLVDPIADLTMTAIPGGPNVVGGVAADISRYGYLMGGVSTWQGQMARATAAGELGPLTAAPVYRSVGGGSDAVLVYPAGARIGVSLTDKSLQGAPANAYVVEPDLWQSTGAAAGLPFDQAARRGYVPGYPTLAQWLSGGTLTYPTGQWNLGPVQSTPATAYDATYLGYSFGFGAYAPGPC